MILRTEKAFAHVKVTANTTLNRNQSGCKVSNTGASGSVTVTLPSGSQEGDIYEFRVVAAQTLTVVPADATDVCILGGTAGTAGHGVTSNTAGANTVLENLGGGKWFVTNSTNWSGT